MKSQCANCQSDLSSDGVVIYADGTGHDDALEIVFCDDQCWQEYQSTIRHARTHYTSDSIEIDDFPRCSRADDGAWIAAWVWVSQTPRQHE